MNPNENDSQKGDNKAESKGKKKGKPEPKTPLWRNILVSLTIFILLIFVAAIYFLNKNIKYLSILIY